MNRVKPRNTAVAEAVKPLSSAEATAAELAPVVQAAERFVAAIEARAIALMMQLGLTMPQLRALMAVRRLGRANGRQLAVAVGITPGAIVGIADHLEQQTYLRRVADPRDRRITWFELTDRGAAALKPTPAIASARSRTKTLLASLSQCEREGFVKIADAFADALESVVQADPDTQRDVADSS